MVTALFWLANRRKQAMPAHERDVRLAAFEIRHGRRDDTVLVDRDGDQCTREASPSGRCVCGSSSPRRELTIEPSRVEWAAFDEISLQPLSLSTAGCVEARTSVRVRTCS